MKILSNLDLSQGQLINSVFQNLTIAPSEAVAGQIYFNTQDKRAYVYTGDVWLGMDAKDSSPTSVSIVNTINDGDTLINIEKINGLAQKLTAANIVKVINEGSENINASKIQGLLDSITSEFVLNKINESSSTIDMSKITGLSTALSNDNIVQNINSGNKSINSDKIAGLSEALAGKVGSEQAQGFADTALQQAKEYVGQEIQKVIGGASEAFDTLKEIEDALKKNPDLKSLLEQGLAKKPDKFEKKIGDNSETVFVVKHDLNTKAVSVSVIESNSPFEVVYPNIEITDENNVTLKFGKAPAENAYNVVVIG